MHEQVVLVTVSTEHVPFVLPSRCARVEQVGSGISRVVLRYGFMQVPRVPQALRIAFDQLRLSCELQSLVYLVGRETLVVTAKGRMGRLTEPVFALLSRNARSLMEDFSIPVEQVVELGMQADL